MIAWSNSNDPDPEKAEMVFQQMIDFSKAWSAGGIRKNKLTGTDYLEMLIECYLKKNRYQGGGTYIVEDVLERFVAYANEAVVNKSAFGSS